MRTGQSLTLLMRFNVPRILALACRSYLVEAVQVSEGLVFSGPALHMGTALQRLCLALPSI